MKDIIIGNHRIVFYIKINNKVWFSSTPRIIVEPMTTFILIRFETGLRMIV